MFNIEGDWDMAKSNLLRVRIYYGTEVRVNESISMDRCGPVIEPFLELSLLQLRFRSVFITSPNWRLGDTPPWPLE